MLEAEEILVAATRVAVTLEEAILVEETLVAETLVVGIPVAETLVVATTMTMMRETAIQTILILTPTRE